VVAEQLGRAPLTDFTVVARCGQGHPLVIRNRPIDRDGEPFPTLFWLTCPLAVKAVSRLESEGWIRRLDARTSEDPDFGRALVEAHEDYARERGRWIPEASGWGGVGGGRGGVKCLHAHYANHLGGGADPIGSWVAERVEPVHPDEERTGRVAAVDIGTNSIRLLVSAPEDDEVRDLARDMIITRLGSGVDAAGRLDTSALRRTVDVLERYVRRAQALGAERIRVGATSAVRDADDRQLLHKEVARVAGVEPEVLSGTQEAELSFLGATADLDVPQPVLVFDIGGGSTELAVGSERPEATVSVDVGSVRITERVGPADPPTDDDLAAMGRLAAEGLAHAEPRVPSGAAGALVGVAGTTTTVQAMAMGLPRYDPDLIHGSTLTLADAERALEDLARMTVAQRRALPFMARGREDVIVAGATILVEILRRWRVSDCVVSERDLLDGLAIEMVRGFR
jgi:exopolyphosphatase / guanosine-5'-triphosphate,3'-diphosphate pyrophosphatase